MSDEVKKRLKEFKTDLNILTPIQIVRKHIIFGECCELSRQDYFDLRSEVAKYFGLHPNEVLVVGSAKLGFSIAPDKQYDLFSDKSDIDIALVSSTLFDEYWNQVFSYKRINPYWNERDFINYLFQGWIRPDKFPRSKMFPSGKDWWIFFQSITSSGKYGKYKIRGGLYQSYFFLENYQKICIQECINKIGGIQ
ncbi:MAG: hypothetical protein OXD54_07885 [Candidatus Poribacteria bacterium]|nr:hypothetical protein [Candidatus Poribacteria bacterium]